MDQMLQKVVGSERMPMLEGLSGYNQVIMDPEDVFKITFTTLWGTFTDVRMPFGLVNARGIYQIAMNFAFANIKDIFIVIYIDDLTISYRNVEYHL